MGALIEHSDYREHDSSARLPPARLLLRSPDPALFTTYVPDGSVYTFSMVESRSSELLWSPVYRPLEERLDAGDDLVLAVVPFIKLAAIERLFAHRRSDAPVKVVVRWRPEDVLAGVSDLTVFRFLKERGCQLYVNQMIHLKLYIFASHAAFNTSGNLTLSGLGYSETANVEVGNYLDLSSKDWAKLYQLIRSSRLVDNAMVQRFEKYINEQPPSPVPPPVRDLLGPAKQFTIDSLPATETPADLARFYALPSHAGLALDFVRRAHHDLEVFHVPQGLSATQLDQVLGDAFRNNSFVRELVVVLRTERSLNFGRVKAWIHDKCEDVPLPYRWELTDNTRILYNWLVHFFDEITWNRPRHSQVIYWTHRQRG